MGIIYPDVCSRCYYICKYRFYCTIYFVGVVESVDIMIHLHKLVVLDSLDTYAPATHPFLLVLPPIVSSLVGFYMCPSVLLVYVTLVCPLINLYPCIQKYPIGSNFYSYSCLYVLFLLISTVCYQAQGPDLLR